MRIFSIAATVLCAATAATSFAAQTTALWSRGYALIPAPQKVALEDQDVAFDDGWTIDTAGLKPNHIAQKFLVDDLHRFHRVSPGSGSARARKGVLALAVRPGTVAAPGEPAVAAQAYRLKISANRIEITGNSDQGLFYGVQSFLQLAKPAVTAPGLLLPAATIDDWPNLQLRFLHWDTKNHQDRMETLRRYLDWSARFKVNMIGFELGDKFEFPSTPEAGAPGAFTTAQMQELTAYARERFIQLVPVIQAPSHLAYVLKHPKYAHLKADGNNYQATLCDEGTYKLIFSMYDDVIRATPGVDYLFVSTDEIYYSATGDKCPKPDTPELRSKLFADFARRAVDYLTPKGRRSLAWLEYPLLARDLPSIPSSVIDGVIGEDDYLPIERQKGMRQLGYLSIEGSELLFPDYMPLDRDLQEQPPVEGAEDPIEFERGFDSGRIKSVADSLRNGRFRQGNPIGAFGAAWDDSGVHNENFWLGWSAAANYAWNPADPSPEQHTAQFMRIYYGPGATGMIDIYRALQRQSRAWQRTWDRIVSRTRGPGYGNSDGKGLGTTRYDQTLKAPALPDAKTLAITPVYARDRAPHVSMAHYRMTENDALLHTLQDQLGRVDRNQYNVEVMLTLTQFIRHHWRLITGMAEAERSIQQASKVAATKPADALRSLAQAYRSIQEIEKDGLDSFRELTAVYEKSQYPKGRPVASKQYLFALDDTKDHWAARTADLGYMYAPEKSIGLERWRQELRRVAATFAAANKLELPNSLR